MPVTPEAVGFWRRTLLLPVLVIEVELCSVGSQVLPLLQVATSRKTCSDEAIDETAPLAFVSVAVLVIGVYPIAATLDPYVRKS